MISILLISIGITFIILSTMVFIDKIRLLKNGVKTDGEVIDFEKSSDAFITEGKEILYITVYKPIIRFKTETGEYRTFTYDNTQNDKIYRVGDKVKLIYPIEDVENIEINDKNNLFKSLCKLIAIGIMFIVFALVLSLV